MRWTTASILLATLSLSGCATSGPVPSAFCDNAKPIYLSHGDMLTAETLRGIVRHNEKGETLCGWKPAQ